MDNNTETIVLIGAGNLGTRLGEALKKAGYTIVQVFSRTSEAAQLLGKQLNCSYTNKISEVVTSASIYIFTVTDAVLESLAKQLSPGRKQALFLHTAGSMPLSVFVSHASGCGVLYPMQTFSKSRQVNFKTIPIFIEGSDEETFVKVKNLATKLSNNVIKISSEQRKYLHLAAVFACNFVNHCYVEAAQLLEARGIPFEIMLPLIEETAAKVRDIKPQLAQTGPAVRFDRNVLDKQRKLLDEETRELYDLMSRRIHETAIVIGRND